MRELLILLGVILFWIALNRWILPWFGIPTCMSGACAVERCPSCGPGLLGSSGHGDVMPNENTERE
jgi:hypothetical protein